MADPKTGRIISQDDWKRTQIRMPQELYDDLSNYAENRSISLNTAMITLMHKGLEISGKSYSTNEVQHQKDLLNLHIAHSELQNKTLKYQDDLISAKEEIMYLRNILVKNNIKY